MSTNLKSLLLVLLEVNRTFEVELAVRSVKLRFGLVDRLFVVFVRRRERVGRFSDAADLYVVTLWLLDTGALMLQFMGRLEHLQGYCRFGNDALKST